jgi:hypothetical protein
MVLVLKILVRRIPGLEEAMNFISIGFQMIAPG